DEPYDRQEFGLYAKDDIQFSSRLKGSLGLRMDGSNLLFGNLQQQFGIPNGSNDALHPRIVQPRIGASWQITRNDAIAASFGRSMQDPYFSTMVQTVNPAFFAPFAHIPAYDNLTGNKGTAVKFCGPILNGIAPTQPCTSYADQLFWEYQNNIGIPVFAVRPEQFSNWDLSFSHEFPNNFALKITPYYRTGQDIIVQTNPILRFNNGVPLLGPTTTTNLGVSKTTGVELLLTREVPYGLSGTLTATYLNELTNVPPLQSSEDFTPFITPASLALGKLYRVGFLSPLEGQLSLEYKTHSGWRINPTVFYIRGYPYNQGSLTPFQLPSGEFAIVPTTNLTNPNGSNQAPCFVDPGNPGTYKNPRYVACRGTAESPDPGGLLTPARFNTNLTIEYTPPRSRLSFKREVTFGVQILGLFNNLYGYPTYNDCYQPVANGVSGPASGYGGCLYSTLPYGNGVNPYVNIRGASPYLLIPNNNYGFTSQTAQAPRLTLFYVQVKL
ncbi:MAG: TonB-dependent receptor, partial [Candidatus Eremiobacteraeota bacterium]|nr:TonB-dependent receptor [Candidatus Eremiobacteraeota bacterium]